MDLLEIYRQQGEKAMVNALYASGREDSRMAGRAGRVEFLTTMRTLQDYVKGREPESTRCLWRIRDALWMLWSWRKKTWNCCGKK